MSFGKGLKACFKEQSLTLYQTRNFELLHIERNLQTTTEKLIQPNYSSLGEKEKLKENIEGHTAYRGK